MNKIKQILRCYSIGMGIKGISATLCVSRNTVRRYVRVYQDCGVELECLLSLSEEHLRSIFYGSQERVHTPSERELALEELLPEYSKRLKQRGMTRAKLHQDYLRKHPDGYSLSTFCMYLKRYNVQTTVVGHVEHRAADQMYIDYTGDKLEIVDDCTGEIRPVEVFVAILPCSHYTFCEAVMSQRKEDLIRGCEDALHFFGGTPAAIVPDNLKAAVTRPDRHEPVINADFEAFAEHYGCAVYPARSRHPQDKALVENAVKLMYTSIYEEVRGKEYHSLDELNKAILIALSRFNDKKMSKRPYSRRELFEDVERDLLRPLPTERFRMRQRRTLTVMQNGYITINRHHYSLPRQFVGKRVEAIYDADYIEIYSGLRLVTTHRRDDTPYEYSRKEEHRLPGRHGSYDRDMEQIYADAAAVDNLLLSYLKEVVRVKRYPAQAFRSCRGIMSLQSRYGVERLLAACACATEGRQYGYNEMLTILRSGADFDFARDEATETATSTPDHKNIRGRDYYNQLPQNNQKTNTNGNNKQ